MMVHGGIPLGEAWAHLRDHAKGTTPYAEDQLALCREFQPPSKAHLKRLAKAAQRASVTLARMKAQPVRPELPIMEAMRLGAGVSQLVAPRYVAHPLPPKPVPPQEPMPKRAASSDADYQADYMRDERKHLLALSRGLTTGHLLSPRRVFLAFGDVNAVNLKG